MMTVHHQKLEQGQSLVELAISFVFLLLLVAGVIDLGRVFFTYITLRDAAEEGALYGVYAPTCTTKIIERVQASAQGSIDASGIQMNAGDITTSPGSDPGDAITVRVTYNFDISMPLLGAAIGGQTFPISTQVTQTILASNPSCP